MKSLKESINENLNESVLGMAGGIIAGLIGFKIVKGVISGLASAGAKGILSSKLKKDAKFLENEWIPRLESLLTAHPNSYKWIKDYWKQDDVKHTLSRVQNTLGSITFVDDCIAKDDWSAEDAEEFRTLWTKAFDTTAKLNRQLVDDIMSAIK